MDFVDKVAEGARDVASNIVKTTSELMEKGKKQLELAKLKGDRRDAMTRLGEIAYVLEKGYGSDEGRTEVIELLDSLNERINAIEADRELERQQRDEERVRRENERAQRNAERTAAGGGPIEVRFDQEQCAECGQNRVGNMAYCGYCGAKFGTKEN